MAYNQNAKLKTHAEHDKPVFVLRVVGVEKSDRIFVKENGLSFIKGDFVPAYILLVLALVPFEMNPTHMYSVCIT